VVAGEGRGPVVEDGNQTALGDQGRDLVVHHDGQAHAGEDGAPDQGHAVEDQPAGDADIGRLTVLLELPGVEAAEGRQAVVDAGVIGEVVRRSGGAVASQVVGRGDDDHAQVRADGDGDHVLAQPLAQTDTGVETALDQIRQAVVDRDLDLDIRIGGQEPLMKTTGYAAYDTTAPLAPFDIRAPRLRANDVAMEILYCGVCHSDLHTGAQRLGLELSDRPRPRDRRPRDRTSARR
jgi:hypothetical protein